MAARILLLVALVALVTANPSNVASKGCEWDIRGVNLVRPSNKGVRCNAVGACSSAPAMLLRSCTQTPAACELSSISQIMGVMPSEDTMRTAKVP